LGLPFETLPLPDDRLLVTHPSAVMLRRPLGGGERMGLVPSGDREDPTKPDGAKVPAALARILRVIGGHPRMLELLDAALLQTAVSSLPVAPAGLARMLAGEEATQAGDAAAAERALRRLEDLSLVHRFPDRSG
jgi:hypothetical protein